MSAMVFYCHSCPLSNKSMIVASITVFSQSTNDFYLSSETQFTCGESVITPDEKWSVVISANIDHNRTIYLSISFRSLNCRLI